MHTVASIHKIFIFFMFWNLQVIVKFINKARIVSDCWVDDPILGRVSQEIAILTRVQHHNIVKVMVWSNTILEVANM